MFEENSLSPPLSGFEFFLQVIHESEKAGARKGLQE